MTAPASDVPIATSYAEAMTIAARHLDAVIDLQLEVIDLRQRMNAIMDTLDADEAVLSSRPDPTVVSRRTTRDQRLLNDTQALHAWRARWLAALETHYRALYAALDAPPLADR